MIFAVMSDTGQVITDPGSGRELGRLSQEKLRVRVSTCNRCSHRAHTFVDTGDFHGLLELPFFEQPQEDVVTVDREEKVLELTKAGNVKSIDIRMGSVRK